MESKLEVLFILIMLSVSGFPNDIQDVIDWNNKKNRPLRVQPVPLNTMLHGIMPSRVVLPPSPLDIREDLICKLVDHYNKSIKPHTDLMLNISMTCRNSDLFNIHEYIAGDMEVYIEEYMQNLGSILHKTLGPAQLVIRPDGRYEFIDL